MTGHMAKPMKTLELYSPVLNNQQIYIDLERIWGPSALIENQFS